MFRLIKNLISLALLITLLYFARYGVRYVFPLDYYPLITEAAEKYSLDPALVCAVIHTESRFDPNAMSQKDASGLMQIMRQTADWGARELGLPDYDYEHIFDPAVNIEIGCWYLGKLYNQYGGDETLALAAYNAGSGNVARWLADSEYSADGKTLDTIPFPETERYVRRVTVMEHIYRVLLFLKDYIY